MSDFYNKYPYTDFHELNLDWVIKTVKDLKLKVDETDTLSYGFITPEMFNAKGDGIHDDSDAFNTAMVYAYNNNKTLRLTAKTYAISQFSLTLPIILDGNMSHIKAISGNAPILIDCPTIQGKFGIVKNIIVDCDNISLAGIELIQNINMYEIRDSKVININTYGIYSHDRGSTKLDNIILYCNHTDHDTYGLRLQTVDNVIKNVMPINCKYGAYLTGNTIFNNFHPWSSFAPLMSTNIGVYASSVVFINDSYIDTCDICFSGTGYYIITNTELFWSTEYYTDASVGDPSHLPTIFDNNMVLISARGVRSYPCRGKSNQHVNFGTPQIMQYSYLRDGNFFELVNDVPYGFHDSYSITMDSAVENISLEISRYNDGLIYISGIMKIPNYTGALQKIGTLPADIRPSQIISGTCAAIGNYGLATVYCAAIGNIFIRPSGDLFISYDTTHEAYDMYFNITLSYQL